MHCMYFGREQMTTCTLASSATVPVENVTLAIASIANIGAKNILVANLPDLGQLIINVQVLTSNALQY